MIQKIKNKNNKHGFSFVEVMVSIFLISVGLIAAVSLVSSNLAKIINNRNQSIAGLLAQEGTELAVNIRDNNVKNSLDSFAEGFPAGDETDCITDPVLVAAGVGLFCGLSVEDEKIYYASNPEGYFYKMSSSDGEETKFSRKLSVDFTPSSAATATSMKIISMVIWGGDSFPDVDRCNSATKCAYAETILTKWKDE